jgi:hypothetical protein
MYALTVGNVQSATSLCIKIKLLLMLFHFAIIFGHKIHFFIFFEFCIYSIHANITVIKRVGIPRRCLPSQIALT